MFRRVASCGGKSTSGIPGLSEFVPAYKQFHIQPAVDVVAVKLGWV